MITYPFTGAGLAAALADLPSDAQRIAEFLAANGIKGKRDDERCCVVANYVKAVIPEADTAEAWDYEISATRFTDEYGSRDVVEAEPSDALGEFIDQFDRGLFPDLIEGASRA